MQMQRAIGARGWGGSPAWFAAAALGLAGCTAKISGPELKSVGSLGDLDLALSLGSKLEDEDISLVQYYITHEPNFLHHGSIPIEGEDRSFKVLVTLPPTTGYHLLLRVETRSGLSCSGSDDFDIVAGQSTRIDLNVQCVDPSKPGIVDVSGRVNLCPTIDSVAAFPGEAFVGDRVELHAVASDPDQGPGDLAVSWIATAGTLDDAHGADTHLLCTSATEITVVLTVSDGDNGCIRVSAPFRIKCLDPEVSGSAGAPPVGGAEAGEGGASGSAGQGGDVPDAGIGLDATVPAEDAGSIDEDDDAGA
jgi:hypothetical protein